MSDTPKSLYQTLDVLSDAGASVASTAAGSIPAAAAAALVFGWWRLPSISDL